MLSNHLRYPSSRLTLPIYWNDLIPLHDSLGAPILQFLRVHSAHPCPLFVHFPDYKERFSCVVPDTHPEVPRICDLDQFILDGIALQAPSHVNPESSRIQVVRLGVESNSSRPFAARYGWSLFA